MKCTSEKGQMTKLDNYIAHQSRGQIVGGFGVFVILRKPLVENTYKGYHVYKLIVLHIYSIELGIKLLGITETSPYKSDPRFPPNI